MRVEKTEQLYEGKAKKVYGTTEETLCIVSYKDDATAFNGLKKGTIMGKGAINNRVTNFLMQMLEKEGIPTHFVEEVNERETIVKKVRIIPLEVIVRNIAAGSLAKRLGLSEGTKMKRPVLAIRTTIWAIPWSMITTSSPWNTLQKKNFLSSKAML